MSEVQRERGRKRVSSTSQLAARAPAKSGMPVIEHGMNNEFCLN